MGGDVHATLGRLTMLMLRDQRYDMSNQACRVMMNEQLAVAYQNDRRKGEP